MNYRRYFEFECMSENLVVNWIEPCLIGDTISEIVWSELSEIIGKYRPSALVMNFKAVNGISSSVIGCLIKVQKELKRYGGQMRLVSVSSTMLEIFRTLNLLGNHFSVCDHIDDAMRESPRRVEAEMQIRLEEIAQT